MSKTWIAQWVTDPRFTQEQPINVFHKEKTKIILSAHREELKNHHMLIRKVFTVGDNFGLAHLDITADDYYKVYVNNSFVGQGPAPSYHFDYNYNQYDISKLIHRGSNVLAVHVYYQGLINRVWNSGDYRQGMIAELFIDKALILKSDETWRYKISNAYEGGQAFGHRTQFPENIDQRKWDACWRRLEYDDSAWDKVACNLAHDYTFKLQPTPSVDVYNVKPKTVKEVCNGHYLIDFGQEITGQFTMTAKGNPGDRVEVRCGEELDTDNKNVKYNMRCNCLYQEFWTLSRGKDRLEHYDYKAFRYVQIISPPNAVHPESFSAVVRHYPFDEDKTNFSSSNQLLNRIWIICKNSVKYGTQEAYLDCPTREKGQYLGDLTVSGHTHLLLTGDLGLYKKALTDFANSRFITPSLMAVAPGSYMQEIADYSLQWPMQLLLYYRHSGDLIFLRSMYSVVEDLMNYFADYENTGGLLKNVDEKWNLVDWPKNLRDGYDFKMEKPHNVINAFYLGMLSAVQEIQSLLNIKDTVGRKLEKSKNSFIAEFYDTELKLFVDSPDTGHVSLHSNALPLLYGLAPTEATSKIVSFIREKGFSCGVYMAYFVLKALAKVGEHQLVFQLLVNESEQSWANMIREGATTCFEAWGKEQKWNTSLCHPWGSGPIPILIEDILGIRPSLPGWKKVSFQPRLPEQLRNLVLKFPVKTGMIHVCIEEDRINIEAPVPIST